MKLNNPRKIKDFVTIADGKDNAKFYTYIFTHLYMYMILEFYVINNDWQYFLIPIKMYNTCLLIIKNLVHVLQVKFDAVCGYVL